MNKLTMKRKEERKRNKGSRIKTITEWKGNQTKIKKTENEKLIGKKSKGNKWKSKENYKEMKKKRKEKRRNREESQKNQKKS